MTERVDVNQDFPYESWGLLLELQAPFSSFGEEKVGRGRGLFSLLLSWEKRKNMEPLLLPEGRRTQTERCAHEEGDVAQSKKKKVAFCLQARLPSPHNCPSSRGMAEGTTSCPQGNIQLF